MVNSSIMPTGDCASEAALVSMEDFITLFIKQLLGTWFSHSMTGYILY